MTDLNSRAAALAGLLPITKEAVPDELARAAVQCSNDLIEAGEPHLALDLLGKFAKAGESQSQLDLMLHAVTVRALRVAGEYEQGLALARSVLENSVATVDYHAHKLLAIWEAACLWQSNHADEAVDKLLGLRAELGTKPDSTLTASCMLELSSAEIFRGHLDTGRAFTLEAIVSSRRCGDRYSEAVAIANLARIDKFKCRWAGAAEGFEESLRISEQRGHRVQSLITRRLLGVVFWKKGDTKRADELAQLCGTEALNLGNDVQQWFAAQLVGLVRLHQGDLREARQILGEGTDRDNTHAYSRRALLTSEFIGDTYLEEGDAQTALDRYNTIWPLAIALVPKGDIVAELRRRRAEALFALARYEEANAEAKSALEHCRELGDRYEEAATYRTLAQCAAKLGRPAEAKQWFQQGFAYYEDIETPYEWGKLWMAYGDWLLSPESGDYADANSGIESYRAAQDLFERMGALGMLKRVNERLAQHATPKVAPKAALDVEPRRPPRRSRSSAELGRRIAWARQTYGFITRNKVVLDLLGDVAKLARSRSPILILGESGTGKELVAHGIHKISERPGNFMPINCGALPREVIESELFGHVAGAFTGAMRDKVGLFESCHRGTVFLDEIAEMSLDLQSRLLRYLESGEFRRVGSNKNVAVDTLVVAATNREQSDLERGEGFRVDLYYRLAHAVVVLPPLRRRGDDVDLLVDTLLDEACARMAKRVALSDEARKKLIAYTWPGNVRQMMSTIQRLVILSPDGHEIAANEVALDQAQAPANLTEELELAERRRIVEALAAASGVRTDAARMLGMSRTTLISKMQRYGIR